MAQRNRYSFSDDGYGDGGSDDGEGGGEVSKVVEPSLSSIRIGSFIRWLLFVRHSTSLSSLNMSPLNFEYLFKCMIKTVLVI